MTRPRGYLVDYNPRARTRVLQGQVLGVLGEYAEQLPLTIRQVFYRLVGTVGFPKDERAYGRLADALGNFRRAGIVPFDAIRDDGATVLAPLQFASPAQVLEMAERLAAEGQGVRLAGQPRHPELWCESAGMAPQLARVAHEFGVTVYSSGGFDSLTVKYQAARRIVARDVPTVVLHVGDLDPSGVTLFQAAMEDVGAFVEEDGGVVELERVAVTPGQVAAYDLPGAPPKASSHARGWRTGDAVQAEALRPDDLAAEVRRAVIAVLDMDRLAEAKSGEAGNREEFDRMMRRLRRDDGEEDER